MAPAMPGDASRARLIKDHGPKWTIEHTGASTAWVAVRRDADDLRIVGAHDVGGLRFKAEQAERDDAGSESQTDPLPASALLPLAK
jgi:hypothetical protein